MAQDEGNLVFSAQVGEPIPGEHALDRHGDVVTIRSDDLEEGLGVAGDILVDKLVAGLVNDADIHRPGMQIDAAVKSVLSCVESHHGPPSEGTNVLGVWKLPAYLLRRGHDEYHCVRSFVSRSMRQTGTLSAATFAAMMPSTA